MIVCFVEASPAVGYGRLTRALVLARHLKHRCRIVFTGHLDRPAGKTMEKTALPFHPVKEASRLPSGPPRLILFDAPPSDANRAVLREIGAAPLVQLREAGEPELDCQVSLKQFPADSEGEMSGDADLFILHPQFRHFHAVERKYKRRVRQIFLYLGGETEYRPVHDLVDILIRHDFRVKIAGDYLVKKSYKKSLRKKYRGLQFSGACQSLARSLFEADLALITPGTIAAEAAAAGTPAVYLSVRKEHRAAAAWWAAQGTGIDAGSLDALAETELVQAMRDLSLDPDRRAVMGRAGKKRIDARGLLRTMDLLNEMTT